MKTSISSKGPIVLPAEIRQQDQITPGQQFEVERLQAGQYLLRRLAEPGKPGLLEWLKSCPEPDWFRQVASESTESL